MNKQLHIKQFKGFRLSNREYRFELEGL
jgi:hypothetical protein